MKIGLLDADFKYLGAVLARAGDDEQAEFLKAFVAECQSWGTHYQVEYQLASVNSKLTPDEREILKMLGYTEEDDHGS